MAATQTHNRLKTAAAPAAAAAFAAVAAIVVGSLAMEWGHGPAPPRGAVAGYLAPAGEGQPNGSPPQGVASYFAPANISPSPLPDGSGPPAAQARRDQAPGAGLPGQSMEIVVKFKDDAKVKDIVDTFWRNAPEAKAKFETFKKSHPAFADTSLDRVTYSNELVLVHPGGAATPAQRLAKMREVANKLKSSPEVSYAEPNLIAQPAGH